MPATSESIAALPPLQRRMAEAWLMRFEENWHDQKLKECMRALPAQSSLRRPLLMAMIQRDLTYQWDSGRPTVIETYLNEYPELGGIDEIPIELLAAEYKARQKHNSSDLGDFAERFPTRIDDLYLLLKPGLFESNVPVGRTATTDSVSARRLQLLRAPADSHLNEPVFERRNDQLSPASESPPKPQPVSETVQDVPSAEPTNHAEIVLQPEPARDEPLASSALSAEPTEWLDIQTVRSNHAASRSAVLKSGASAPPMPPSVLGRYAVEKRLGRSGFGSIYQATDKQLDRRVTLKIPHFSGPAADAAKSRFRREARSAAGLCHPLLCPVLDAGQIDGIDFLAMPYVDGDPLDDLLRERPVWPAREAIDLIVKLAIALDAAHRRGVAHRDLKPSNILFAPGETPIIVGWGQSTEPVHSQRTANAVYVAPEQSGSSGETSGTRCDIYSLGVILQQLLTGKRPQQIPGVDPFPPNLDSRLIFACRKAIATDANSRYATLHEFIDDLIAARPNSGPSNLETRPPSGGPDSRQAPTKSTGLSAVPGLTAIPALSAVPGFGVGQGPGNTSTQHAPGSNNTTYAQMQELRELSNVSARTMRPAKHARGGRRSWRQHWKYLAAGAIGGMVLVGTIFTLSSIQNRRRNDPDNNRPPEQTQPKSPIEPKSPPPPSIEELSSDLSSSKLEARLAAIEQFKSRKEPEAVELLIRFISEGEWLEGDPNGTDRTKALQAIKKLDNLKMITAIKQAYASSDMRVRGWALDEIAGLADSDFRDDLLPLLLSALKSGNPELRQAAAERIEKRQLNNETVIKALADRVSDDQWGVPPRRPSRNVFERSPDKDGGKNAALKALLDLAREKVRPALEAAAMSSNPDVKLWALDRLKEL